MGLPGERPPSHADRSNTLDYQNPTTDTPPDPRSAKLALVVRAMAVAWPVVAVHAGVASDWVKIPTAKKLALTAGGFVIAGLMFSARGKLHIGWAVAFLWIALGEMLVMWYWN